MTCHKGPAQTPQHLTTPIESVTPQNQQNYQDC